MRQWQNGPREWSVASAIFHFSYRLYRPQDADGEALVLLHGSGVDETTLVPLAAEIAPRAMLIAVRGRIAQDGGMRWFARITPTRFEQQSIRTEADAFAGFIVEARRPTASISRARHSSAIRTAPTSFRASCCCIPGLSNAPCCCEPCRCSTMYPPTDLSKARVLVIAGAADATYAPFAPALVTLLREHGAEVEARTVALGHEFGAEDAGIVRDWLAGPTASAAR